MTRSSRFTAPLRSGARLALVTAALTLGVTTGAMAAQAQTQQASKTAPPAPPPGGPGLAGSIKSISGNVITVTTMPAHKTITIHLTASTRYVVNGKTTAKRPTLKQGESIGIAGTRHSNGSYVAQRIMIGGPPAGAPPTGGPPGAGTPPLNGTVVSASGSALVIKTATGSTTVHITSSTRYLVNGKAVSSRPSLKKGEQIHIMASKTGSTYTAQVVIVGTMPAGPGGPPPGAPQP